MYSENSDRCRFMYLDNDRLPGTTASFPEETFERKAFDDRYCRIMPFGRFFDESSTWLAVGRSRFALE